MRCECGYEADNKTDLDEHIVTAARSEYPGAEEDHAEAR